eukprot:m.221522 g.221522  ORF g.221522 m.221522 type:complete len:1632 (+) comp13841_c1_seq2:159-5054(+)
MDEGVSEESVKRSFLHALQLPNAQGLASHLLQLHENHQSQAILSSQFVQSNSSNSPISAEDYECRPVVQYDALFQFIDDVNKTTAAMRQTLLGGDLAPSHALFGIPQPSLFKDQKCVLIAFHCNTIARTSASFLAALHLYFQSVLKKSHLVNAVRSGEDGMFCFKAPVPATQSNINVIVDWFSTSDKTSSSSDRKGVEQGIDAAQGRHQTNKQHRKGKKNKPSHLYHDNDPSHDGPVQYELLDCLHSIQASSYDCLALISSTAILNLQLVLHALMTLNIPIHIYSFNHFKQALSSLAHVAEQSLGSLHTFEGDISLVFPSPTSLPLQVKEYMQLLSLYQRYGQAAVSILLNHIERCEQKGSLIDLSCVNDQLSIRFGVKSVFEDEVVSRLYVEEMWIANNSLFASGLDLTSFFVQCMFIPVSPNSILQSHRDAPVFAASGFSSLQVPKQVAMSANTLSLFPKVNIGKGPPVPMYLSEIHCKLYADGVRAIVQNLQDRLKAFELSSLGLFGSVSYRRIVLIIDNSARLHVFRHLLTSLLSNFVSCQLVPSNTLFNIVTCEESPKVCFNDDLVSADENTAQRCVAWWKSLPREQRSGNKEAENTPLLNSLKLVNKLGGLDACYVLSSRGTSTSDLEILSEKMIATRNIKFHTVSVACRHAPTNALLHTLAATSGGSFNYFSSLMLDIFSTRAAIQSATQSSSATPSATPTRRGARSTTPHHAQSQYEIIAYKSTTGDVEYRRSFTPSSQRVHSAVVNIDDVNLFSAIGPKPICDTFMLHDMRVNLSHAHHAISKAQQLLLESQNAAMKAFGTEQQFHSTFQQHREKQEHVAQFNKENKRGVGDDNHILAFASSDSDSSSPNSQASSQTLSPHTTLTRPQSAGKNATIVSSSNNIISNGNRRPKQQRAPPFVEETDSNVSIASDSSLSTQPLGDVDLDDITHADEKRLAVLFDSLLSTSSLKRHSSMASLTDWINCQTLHAHRATVIPLLKRLPSTRHAIFSTNAVFSIEHKGKLFLCSPSPSVLERYISLVEQHCGNCFNRYVQVMKMLMMPAEKQRFGLCSRRKKRSFLDSLVTTWQDDAPNAQIDSVHVALEYKRELEKGEQCICEATLLLKYVMDALTDGGDGTHSSSSESERDSMTSCMSSCDTSTTSRSVCSDAHTRTSSRMSYKSSSPKNKKNKRFVSEKQAIKQQHQQHKNLKNSKPTYNKKNRVRDRHGSTNNRRSGSTSTRQHIGRGTGKSRRHRYTHREEERFDGDRSVSGHQTRKKTKDVKDQRKTVKSARSEGKPNIAFASKQRNYSLQRSGDEPMVVDRMMIFGSRKDTRLRNVVFDDNDSQNSFANRSVQHHVSQDEDERQDLIGRHVLVAREEDGYLYPATVKAVNINGVHDSGIGVSTKFSCLFSDGKRVCIDPSRAYLRWTKPTPPLRKGNFVFTKLSLTDYGDAWVPGCVSGVTVRPNAPSLFTVKTMNGTLVHGDRSDFVKISREDHMIAAEYISSLVDDHLDSLLSSLQQVKVEVDEASNKLFADVAGNYMARSTTPTSKNDIFLRQQRQLHDAANYMQFQLSSTTTTPVVQNELEYSNRSKWSTIPIDEDNCGKETETTNKYNDQHQHSQQQRRNNSDEFPFPNNDTSKRKK